MPADILAQLSRMASELMSVAIVWQLVVLVVTLAVLFGWQPSRRLGAILLVTPVVSVSALSIAYGSWFNGVSFAVLALTLVALASRLPSQPSTITRGWPVYAGIAMIVFGMNYTHFFAWEHGRVVYASPVGVIPCPTLALVAGIVLLTRGFGSRLITITVAVWSTFYAVVGVTRLGVTLDVLLVAGAVALWVSPRARFGSSGLSTR